MVDVALNEIVITPKVSDATLALRADLYDIESANTAEARIQSVATATGNEHTVQKFSTESTIATKVPSGIFELSAAVNRGEEVQQLGQLILVRMKVGMVQ